MPRLQLNAALIEQIAAGVRAGGYPHVAAQAWGVPKTQFDEWMAKGARGRGTCGLLVRTMEQAHAQARLRAEMIISRDEHRIWLEHGPARDQPNNPGWSSSPRPATPNEGTIFTNADAIAALRRAGGALGENSQARQQIADAIEHFSL